MGLGPPKGGPFLLEPRLLGAQPKTLRCGRSEAGCQAMLPSSTGMQPKPRRAQRAGM
jgi:hypothetical protein